MAQAAILIVAAERGGGEWPPVAAMCEEWIRRGERVAALCDGSAAGAFARLGAEVVEIPPHLGSTPIVNAIFENDVMPFLGKAHDDSLPNPLEKWAEAVFAFGRDAAAAIRPNLIVGTIFTSQLALALSRSVGVPFVCVNPAFYYGPDPPRPLSEDYTSPTIWFFEHCYRPALLQAEMVLHATDQQFDLGFTGFPENHHYTGPLVWDPPGDAPAFMSEPGDPWVTASVSTVSQDGEMDLLRVIVQAAADLPVRVLLTAPDHDHSALGPLPANVRLERFVPHGPALQQSALMVSHAGHGATIKGLWHGVPMVLTPWDRDQPGCAHRAVRLGVACSLRRGEVGAETLSATIGACLEDEEMRAAAAHHRVRLQQTDPRGRACDLLSRLL